MLDALVAALALGAISTCGDLVWHVLALPHRMSYGLVHGAVICLSIGAVIGIRERRPVPAMAAGPVIGLAAASGFYLLAPWLHYSAMFPMWMLFWLCFALLQEWLGFSARGLPDRARPEPDEPAEAPPTHEAAGVSAPDQIVSGLRTAVLRGLLAAGLSGLAFYAISGIWTQPSPGGPSYARHFLSWSFAFLPGFLALFVRRRRPPRS